MGELTRRILGTATLIAGLAAGAEAAPAVTWITYDFPPGFIIAGKFAGQGSFDRELRYFTEHMPGFEHQILLGSFTRAWYEIAHKDGVCVIGAGRTPPREAVAKFSQIAFATTPLGVILRSDRQDRFRGVTDDKGRIDLALLGGAASLRGQYIPGRAYTPAIDGLVHSSSQAMSFNAVPSMAEATRAIDQAHADYVFGYRHELAFYRSTTGLSREMSWVSIKGQPRLMFSHIACSAGPIGASVVAEADRIIVKAGLPPDYSKLETPWESPADLAIMYDPALWERLRREGFPGGQEAVFDEETR